MLITTTDDMFVVTLEDVLTMSESTDIEMILMYQDYMRSSESDKNATNQSSLDRKMGRLGNVNDVKEILEKIYNKTQE